MSVQWTLDVGPLSAQAAEAWLLSRVDAVVDGSGITLGAAVWVSVEALKPYEVAAVRRAWSVEATTQFYLQIGREADVEAAYTTLYDVALNALHDFPGDVAFAMLDVGIFARRSGRLVVNLAQFQFDPRLLARLPQPNWEADPPTHLLVENH